MVRDWGIDHPVVLPEGPAQRDWKVSSLPVTYVVDPAGHIAGGFRGAVDADALAEEVEGAGVGR